MSRYIADVSVVIPTHNRRALLPEAIASCLAQTHPNVGVIVVDDGSTDGTEEMISALREQRDAVGRVQFVKQSRRGASAARNRGLQIARSAYVQFLDSDDLLRPAKLERQVGVLEDERNRGAACCNCYGSIATGSSQESLSPIARIGLDIVDPRELIRQLCSRVVHGMQTSAPLWRRDFLVSRDGWREDISLGDDLEYHIRMLAGAKQICFVDEQLFVVREHGGPRLGVDGTTEHALSSAIDARRSIFDVLCGEGLWDVNTQRAFLTAMRGIYASALQRGGDSLIRNLEDWMLQLASAPTMHIGTKSLILGRRTLGAKMLLRAHRAVMKFRGTH